MAEGRMKSVLLACLLGIVAMPSQAKDLTFTAGRIADASVTFSSVFHRSRDASRLLKVADTGSADRFRKEVLAVPRAGRVTWSILLPRRLPSVESVEARSQAINLRHLQH